MASVQPVLRATADLVYALHNYKNNVPQDILKLADDVERALTEYQWAVDYAQEKRTNYRVKGKKSYRSKGDK